MLPFTIAFKQGRPAFRQLAEALERAVLSGQLRPGDELPSWLAVARELRLHPASVRRAFDLLEEAGWLLRSGSHLRVGAPGPVERETARRRLLRPQAVAMREEARRLGAAVDELQHLLEEDS